MEPIILEAGPSSIGFCVDGNGLLRQVGFGPGLDRGPLRFPAALYPLAYPTFGEDPFAAPGLRVTNASGRLSTRLVVDETERTDEPGCETITFTMRDHLDPLTVRLHVRAWAEASIIEQWIQITNEQAAPIVIHEAAAATPVLSGSDARLEHFTGDWGAEFTPVHDRLTAGTKVLEARAVTRPAHEVAPYVRFAPDGEASETHGDVLAVALAWGGNTRMAFEVARHGLIRSWFGHLPTGADYTLDPSGVLTTPRVVFAWSDSGTRSLTHRLHRWVREQVLRDGNRDRPVVVNNWEATGFAFDSVRLERFCDETAEVGGEVFLLDDGWFGDDFPRDDDSQGLGDWVVDTAKLPDGLAGVGRSAESCGVRFGVWVEPEMVNSRSRLAAEHPDWVVGEPGRPRREERNQLQLDLCRGDVQRHVRSVLDYVLEPHNGVSFIKWDANRMVTEPGSLGVPTDRQGNWPVEVIQSLWQTMDQIAQAHPTVEMMLCASGGGRMDLGTLSRFHEVWLSDNTDPVDRVRLQWHASQFLPVSSLAAHVTRWGERPVAFACAVAMSARFGFDLNRDEISDEEWAICRRAAGEYKTFRAVIQRGDLYRLISPDEGDDAALAFVTPDRTRAIVFAYRLPHETASPPPRATSVYLDAFDPDQSLAVRVIDLDTDAPPNSVTLTGRELADLGLDWQDERPCTAMIWSIESH